MPENWTVRGELSNPRSLGVVGLGVLAVSTVIHSFGIEEARWGMGGGAALAGIAAFMYFGTRVGNDTFKK